VPQIGTMLLTNPAARNTRIYSGRVKKKDGENRYNFLTTAVWENEEAFENAKKAVAIEYQKQGFNPQETRKKLKIGKCPVNLSKVPLLSRNVNSGGQRSSLPCEFNRS